MWGPVGMEAAVQVDLIGVSQLRIPVTKPDATFETDL